MNILHLPANQFWRYLYDGESGLYIVQLVGPTSMYTYQWVDENGLFMEKGQAKNQP